MLTKKTKASPLFVVSRTLLASLPLSGLAYAADQTWLDGNANNDWSTAVANWNGAAAWTDTNHAIFAGTGETVTLTTPITVGNITFSSGGYTIAGDATNFLTLGASTIDTGANNATISSKLAGTQGLTKSGVGTLTLSGNNSYSGTTAVNGGTLILKPSTSNNTTYNFASGYTLSNSATLRFDVSDIGAASGFVTVNVGQVNTTGGTVELYSTNAKHDVVGDAALIGWSGAGAVISGSGNLTVDGGGFVNLNTTNALTNFTGTLNLNAGTFQLQGPSTSTVGNFAVQFNGGTLDVRTDNHKMGALNGTGTIVKSFSSASTLTIGSNNADGDFSGNITGAGNPSALALTKEGTGTQKLSGTHSYTGLTSVTAGTLLINGAKNGAGAVNVAAAGTLGGTGTIAGAVNVTGKLAPGDNSIQSLGTGALTFATGSTLAYELNSTTPNADLLIANGTLDLTGTVNLTLTDLGASVLAHGTKFTLINYASGWTSTELFTYQGSALADNSIITLGSNQWLFDYNDTAAGINTFAGDATVGSNYVTMTVVPEPSVALLGGLGALALLRRRRNG